MTRSPRSVAAEMVDAMKTLCKLDDIELSVRGGPSARTRGPGRVQANQMGPEYYGVAGVFWFAGGAGYV